MTSASPPAIARTPTSYISNADNPCVRLYIPIPAPPGPNARQWPSSPVVRVPVLAINRLNVPPLVWVTYVGYVICGRVHGTLSYSHDEPPVVVPHLPGALSEHDVDLYFHPNGTVQLSDHRAQDAADSTRAYQRLERAFDVGVKARDNDRCLFSGIDIPELLQAAHLIRHNKGDPYISLVSACYSPNEEGRIDEIDNIRNGVYVSISLHTLMGLSSAAIMGIPNDIIQSIPPTSSPPSSTTAQPAAEPASAKPAFQPAAASIAQSHPLSTARELVLHSFLTETVQQLHGGFVPANKTVRCPISDAPPQWLLDIVYAGHILKLYSNPPWWTTNAPGTSEQFYPDGVMFRETETRHATHAPAQEKNRASLGSDTLTFSDCIDNILHITPLYASTQPVVCEPDQSDDTWRERMQDWWTRSDT